MNGRILLKVSLRNILTSIWLSVNMTVQNLEYLQNLFFGQNGERKDKTVMVFNTSLRFLLILLKVILLLMIGELILIIKRNLENYRPDTQKGTLSERTEEAEQVEEMV